MKKKRSRRQRAIIRRRIFLCCCAAVLAVFTAAVYLAVNTIMDAVRENEKVSSDASGYSSSEEPEEPYVVSSATVVNTGDLLIHGPVLNGAYNSADGSYDFTDIFSQVKKYFGEADLAVANLEVTLGGEESGKYKGYPAFNTPDSLIDAAKDAGIGLLLTANNHCYDTGIFGVRRTIDVLENKGISHIGTRRADTESTYFIKSVNGVKIGMTAYTYENTAPEGRKSINGNIISTEANALINSFSYDRLDSFYTEAEQMIKDMKDAGADAVVFYMHWGEEYQLTQNTWQKTIAQKLCNFGVDIIVGGHPHVVQPIDLLTSEDSQNTTVCIYSLGNAVSNQRKENINSCPTGHTEDGMLFYYTFDKYSDGTTVLSGVDIIPTWVNKYKGGGGYLYTIYPLQSSADGSTLFGFTGDTASKASASFERTKAIVAQGLTACQQALGCEIRFEE